MTIHPSSSSSSSSTTTSGEWTVVLHHRRRRRSRKHNQNLPKVPPPDLSSTSNPLLPIPWAPSDPSPASPSSISSLLLKIRSSTLVLSSSPFFHRLLSHLRSHQHSPILPTVQMVVYGVGSLSSYEPPRLQLSLALLLHRELRLLPPVEIFDPVLTSAECTALSHLGCRVLPFNEAGCREVSGPTLFYMPHCHAALYHNLLGTNWRRESLNHLVVLGNSFRRYADSVEAVGRGSRVGRDAVAYVLRASEVVEEVRVDEGLEEEGDRAMFAAFHSTSWHFFHLDDDWDEAAEDRGVDKG